MSLSRSKPASIRPSRDRVLGALPARRLAGARRGPGAWPSTTARARRPRPWAGSWASAPSTTTRRSCCGGRTSTSSTSSPTPSTHARFVDLAVAHRKPVICQKPMANDLATAERMVRACREAGRPALHPRELALAGPDPGPEGRARRGEPRPRLPGAAHHGLGLRAVREPAVPGRDSSGSSSPTWGATSSTWRASSSARRRPSTAGPPGSTRTSRARTSPPWCCTCARARRWWSSSATRGRPTSGSASRRPSPSWRGRRARSSSPGTTGSGRRPRTGRSRGATRRRGSRGRTRATTSCTRAACRATRTCWRRCAARAARRRPARTTCGPCGSSSRPTSRPRAAQVVRV